MLSLIYFLVFLTNLEYKVGFATFSVRSNIELLCEVMKWHSAGDESAITKKNDELTMKRENEKM